MAVKVSIGKWQLNRSYEDFIDHAVNKYSFMVLLILAGHTAQLIVMPFHHKDPFGRLLIAQALSEHLPIIGNDRAMDAYGVTRLW